MDTTNGAFKNVGIGYFDQDEASFPVVWKRYFFQSDTIFGIFIQIWGGVLVPARMMMMMMMMMMLTIFHL